MFVMATNCREDHIGETWAELMRKCGYKAEVRDRQNSNFVVEIKPNNSYSRLEPPFTQLYDEEYGEHEAVEDLSKVFAIKFLSKEYRIIEVHNHNEWVYGKRVENRSPWHDV